MRIKVCGITRAEDAKLACALGAWAVGFVFVKGSPRAVAAKEAALLRKAVKPGVLAVGVFADAPRRQVLEIIRSCRLDAVQFHGRETPEYCQGYPVPIYKALDVDSEARLMERYRAAGFLIEPQRALSERRRDAKLSVRAQRAAWAAAAKFSGFNVILAGGLNSANVRQAAEKARPFAVDVSGGVEEAFGIKAPEKLRAFFAALKGV